MIHKKHPRITLLAIGTFIASGIAYYFTGASTQYLYTISIPGSTLTQVITNIFFKNPIIGLLTFIALAVGILQYSGEGYNEIEL